VAFQQVALIYIPAAIVSITGCDCGPRSRKGWVPLELSA